MKKMIVVSEGNIHDIDHFIRVWTYAKTIGELEGLDEDTQFTLEAAAIIHDIACPLCREKYGNTNGKYQEEEGAAMTRPFLEEFGIPDKHIERIEYLVGHHHTFSNIDGIDYQILVEADYIANASENSYPESNVRNFIERVMRTQSGISIANAVLLCSRINYSGDYEQYVANMLKDADDEAVKGTMKYYTADEIRSKLEEVISNK